MANNLQARLAVDLGASGGRVVAGLYDGARLELSEVMRFANEPVKQTDGWHWNLDALFTNIKHGIALATKRWGRAVASVGVDTWGVDYGLVDAKGALLGAPFQYRDSRTQGMQEAAFERMPRREIYGRTGIQFMFFNTLFQLLAEKRGGQLERAERLLFMPDLVHFLLTGRSVNEKTIASTSQLLDPRAQRWDLDLAQAMDLPKRIFGELVDAGTDLGGLLPGVAAETGATHLRVIAPAGHDTASAVIGAPASEEEPVFLSSGTWSLLGRELAQPVISDASYAATFSNEGGAFGTTRFLKNIAGMWLLQECKRAWEGEGDARSYADLIGDAESAPGFAACIDANAPDFDAPADMPGAIRKFCEGTGQPAPANHGAMTRMILESLALKYRCVAESLARVTGKPVSKVYVIGGGSQNRLLNQFTADALRCAVVAGPVEATSIGNILMQLHAAGEIGALSEARALTRRSFDTVVYEPKNAAAWDDAHARFGKIVCS